MSPDCLAALRSACKARGMRKVAADLGYSHTAISLVLGGKYMSSTDRLERRVRERLLPGGTEPDWLARLRQEVRGSTQEQVAMRLGTSPATLSQVLSGSYGAATTRIERRVRGLFMGAECECPVLRDVPTNICQEIQERKQDSFGNYIYMQAWFACRGMGPFSNGRPCPHFNVGGQRPPKEPA